MRVNIIIEQFQNGISVKWRNDAGDGEDIVALTDNAKETLGRMILEDFDEMKCGKVEMAIEYKAIEED